MTSALELRDLSIGYRTRRRTATVAAGLQAFAHRGELTVLLGPNGTGKSTLIRTVCGLQPALGGRVLLDGGDLTGLAPDELARRVAVVLTERVDPGLLSARELAGLGRIPHLGLRSVLRQHDTAVVDWALSAVGADHLAARPAAELSDGERQRVLTARALAQQPSLLVLDEPTAFLDVSSRAGLLGLLRRLARDQQLAVLMSTHDLELALRVADRVWLLGPDGTLVDAIGEELMLSGRIGELFNSETLHFDSASGVFAFNPGVDTGRVARVDAADPLRAALTRVLSREDWRIGDAPEIVVTATDSDAVTVRSSGHNRTTVALSSLPRLLRSLPASSHRYVPTAQVNATLAELSAISPYFTVATGPVEGDWPSMQQLYTEPALLDDAVEKIRTRIDAPDRRTAASTLFLGFAARFWSIGLGMLAGYGLLPDISPEQLRYSESENLLHLTQPVAWGGDGLESMLADMVLDAHLAPLATALRRLEPISEKLLRGNTAAAILGAARVFDHRRCGGTPGPAWRLARTLCEDGRLAGAVRFDDTRTGYRRNSCCLYYRTPGAGLCGDCVLTHKPQDRTNRKDRNEPS